MGLVDPYCQQFDSLKEAITQEGTALTKIRTYTKDCRGDFLPEFIFIRSEDNKYLLGSQIDSNACNFAIV